MKTKSVNPRQSSRLKLSLLGISSLAAVYFCFAGDRGLPAQHGILNFGKVSEHLYRGAEPDAAGVKNLKQLGIATIIDLRNGREVRAEEAKDAATEGITYTNVPFAGLGRPTDKQVAQVLAIIEASPGPVFVHCEHGCDRTGTVIASYRIRHDGWSGEAAQKEADIYGMSKLEVGMRGFIAQFGTPTAKK